MNPVRLLEFYDRIADAPDATKRLRRLVLDLAVRGKLVAQDPTDEPPSCIGLSHEPDAPYGLPTTWRWARIGEQLELFNGMAFKPTDWISSGLRIVRIQNLNNEAAAFNYCDPAVARDRSVIGDGSFLISWSGTPGTSFGAFIWERGSAVLNQHIFRCDFKTKMFYARYLRLAINGRLDEMIAKAHGGVGLQHITKGSLESLLIGLPPLPEQHRIVAKVDELMTLCDRLEAAREAREAVRDRLAAASFARLRATDPETFQADARFALDALPALTTRPDQIKQLRQTVLSLAVQGLLLEQDHSSTGRELAAELQSSQAKLIKERILNPTVLAKSQTPGEMPFGVPPTWTWVSLGNLIAYGPQNGISPRPSPGAEAPKAITLTATTSGRFNGAHFKRVEGSFSPNSDYWLQPGDLLFQRGNTPEYVGMAAIYEGVPGEYLYPDLIMKVRLLKGTSLRFVHLCAIAPYARSYFSRSASGAQVTMPKINQGALLGLPVPLPPLAEQQRIVAKVDEVMTICDRLEASLARGEAARQRLLGALLAEATAPVREAA